MAIYENKRKKKKGKTTMWIVILVVFVVIIITAGAGILFTSGERKEGLNLKISSTDFKNLKDGTYIGEYAGGKYKWRANKVQVTVSSGKVTDINLLLNKENRPAEFTDKLFGRVIESQSLQVDAISGATITSKAYLKSVEDALDKADE
ncbi:FMN-binding protein [Anaerocolumna sp. MB42-C2]|uniref:FMN-binding protein n=1 Tax=Anaerocolumna sp. MB42-C2 TaxID=3070997 RepID=UPI0027E1070A|nr:FMN-binding protein [Anaerocolumna sp. MB42-C2]WMJ90300.1 FMN-binding protein [Anaerocolumna sp. MB42-C2]